MPHLLFRYMDFLLCAPWFQIQVAGMMVSQWNVCQWWSGNEGATERRPRALLQVSGRRGIGINLTVGKRSGVGWVVVFK